MGLHKVKVAELTGLAFDNKHGILRGEMEGYPVYVKQSTGRSTVLLMQLHGKQRDALDLKEALADYQTRHPGIVQLLYRDRELTAMIAIAAKDSDNAAAENIRGIAALAKELGLIPCCSGCGAEWGYAPYLLDGNGSTLCDSCKPRVEELIARAAEEKRSEKTKPLGTALGLILGVSALVLVTFFMLKSRYIPYLTGYVGALVTLLLMKKLGGGRLTYAAAVIGVAACLLAAAVTPVFGIADDIASFNREKSEEAQQYVDEYDRFLDDLMNADDEERAAMEAYTAQYQETLKTRYEEYNVLLSHQTMTDCVKDMPTLMKTEIYGSVKGELIKAILFGVLSIIVGCAVTLPGLLRESYGKHALIPLS